MDICTTWDKLTLFRHFLRWHYIKWNLLAALKTDVACEGMCQQTEQTHDTRLP